jgi:hypothetical protein
MVKLIKLPLRFLICVFMTVVLGIGLVLVAPIEWALRDSQTNIGDLTWELKYDIKNIWTVILCRK